MNDEQVNRIVDALAGDPFEPVMTAAVAVVSVLLGFGLSQLAERATRRRAEKSQHDAQRMALVVSTLEVTYITGASGVGALRSGKAGADIAARMAALQGYSPDGGLVASWWLRQMARLTQTPTDDQNRGFTDEEQSVRAAVTASVASRLNFWGVGEIDGPAFEPQNDERWDRIFKVPPRT